jgi:hypothetical protein
MKRTANRTQIKQNWTPGPDEADFAEKAGIDWNKEAPKFIDYHLAHGSLMASWPAAWRTWIRNAAAWMAKAQPVRSDLVSLSQAKDDAYGAGWWASTLGNTTRETIGAQLVICVNGYDVVAVARDCCAAAGLAPEWRGDLSSVEGWLREGIDPDAAVAAIQAERRKPARIASMRYFDLRVRNHKAA